MKKVLSIALACILVIQPAQSESPVVKKESSPAPKAPLPSPARPAPRGTLPAISRLLVSPQAAKFEQSVEQSYAKWSDKLNSPGGKVAKTLVILVLVVILIGLAFVSAGQLH